jgi:hypothetical protein
MQRYLIILLFACISLAACAQQEDIQALPTLAPSPTTEIVTEPPTPTEIKRATLPPTWTPVQEVTPTATEVTPTVSVDTPIPPPTPLEVCATFGEDRTQNKRTFTFGDSPTVYWMPVQGAVQYSISLVDETSTALYVDYTADTKFTFDASLFEQGKLYGWEAYPIDNIGQQMCLARGAELFPQQP